jgi:TPR repeat protein
MHPKKISVCCGKIICFGCFHEHELQSDGSPTCPFCRAPKPSPKEFLKMLTKRADANDPRAIDELGMFYRIKKDSDKAIKLFHRAAELGSAYACGFLAVSYMNDSDGVIKNEAKAVQYCEEGAILGDRASRTNLGGDDANAGNFGRAIKH